MSEPASTRPPNYFSRAERESLCDDLLRIGPDAPTLCTGWTTRDLAAHLVVREGTYVASAGVRVKPLAGLNRHAMTKRTRMRWSDLVGKVRSGPPPWSAFRSAKLDGEVNTIELFVHHEDVLRAQPDYIPRALTPELEAELTKRLPRVGKFILRRVPLSVTVHLADGTTMAITDNGPTVQIAGPIADVLMELYGRSNDRVEITGEPAAVATWRTRSGV